MAPSEIQLTLSDVRRRFVRGWLALALRGGAGKLVTLGALVLLSRHVAPEAFGAFAVLQLPLGLLTLLADGGLHSALVQRDALTPDDETAGFSLRLVLAIGSGLLLALLAGPVAAAYHLPAEAAWALRALCGGPVLDALGTVPGVRLTRNLRFGRLAWAEMASLLAGQGTAVAMALSGSGIWALVGGALATSLGGLLAVTMLAPWRPRFGLPAYAVRRLMDFGWRFQAQGVLQLLRDRVTPALGGLLLNPQQVGYLAWAQDLARWPRVPADYTARVGFPAFARLQRDPAGLTRSLNEALLFAVGLGTVLSAGALALAPRLLAPVFGAEWLPALAPLLIFLAQTPLEAAARILLTLIYATGQAGRGLRLSFAWLAVTWLLCGAALWLWHDLRAIPVGFALATLLALGLIVAAKRRSEHEIKWTW